MIRKSTIEVARRVCARIGDVYLFPIKPGQKAPPCFKNELELASNDPRRLASWDSKYGGPNWGVSNKKSGLIVLDVDQRDGKPGPHTLIGLELLHGDLPPTLTVRTPSGGKHYYFRETERVKHRALVGVHGFGEGIDSTNYVVAFGCALADGGRYQVMSDAPIADAPDWFAEYLTARDASADTDQTIPQVELDLPANIDRAIHFLKNDARPSMQGRNGEFALLMVAAELKDMGISQHTSIQLLAEHYNVDGKCDPLWMIGDGPIADRLDVKVDNAWNYLRKNAPGARTPEADFGEAELPSAADMKRLTEWWAKHDREQRIRKAFCEIGGKLYPVARRWRKKKVTP